LKKKKRHHFRNCAFLFGSGDTNILTLASLGQDGRYLGFNKENRFASQLFFMPKFFIQSFGLIQFTAKKNLSQMTQVFLVERSIELSNLIWVGLEQIEYHFFLEIANENRV
jgi:hypothetical protein